MQPPSLWYQSHPYRHHHPGTSSPHHPDIITGSYQSHPYPHRHIAPGTSSPHHPDIITPAHRVITLQGMEAYTMQAKRDAGSRHTSRNIGGRVTHPAKEKKPPQATEGGQCAIGMQAATPMSDRVVTSHTHPDIITSSYYPARCGSNGAGQGCRRPHW